MAAPTLPIVGISTIIDSTGNDLTTDSSKVRQDAISTLNTTGVFDLFKAMAIVAVSMNDTYTTLQVNGSNFTTVTNSSVFCRPNFENHLFFDGQWIINVTTSAGTAPIAPLTVNLQTWLNNYHILISPTGFANDFTITLPAIGANQTWTFPFTLKGGIFNLELRKVPDFHLVDFRYNLPSLPSGWLQVQLKPRFTIVSAVPSSEINFQTI